MLVDHLPSHELRELLEKPGFLTPEEFTAAVSEAQHSGKSLPTIILEKSYLTTVELTRLAADHFHLPFFDLSRLNIPAEVIRQIPELVAREHLAVAIASDAAGLRVALVDPLDAKAIAAIKKATDLPVVIGTATEEDILAAFGNYPHQHLDNIKSLALAAAKDSGDGNHITDAVIELFAGLISFAAVNHTSDIHLEPYEDRYLVRYRVDGVLHHVIDLPQTIGQLLINRIKVLAKMKLDRKNAAQDGKFRFGPESEVIDIRASVAPLVTGEKVVMRLLSSRHRSLNLSDLGLSAQQLQILQAVCKKKQGMIVACGPTGSGKTATLYALLKMMNSEQVNIASIEDPVEYDLEGVNQLQVNESFNLSFSEGLKVILRQDPDIIMISDIRDISTAHLANSAALTGHIVLTSLDGADAVGAIIRLRELELDPFTLATSLNAIIGQRLVRRICSSCRLSYDLNKDEAEIISRQFRLSPDQVPKHLYRGKGCDVCGQTGYRGRIGLFEIVEIGERLKRFIIDNAPPEEIIKAATESGWKSLHQDALMKVAAGVTSAEEVFTVLQW
ncbi:MAG: ATPase, T2SS/T4P/T4SS family [Candidatus Komeilibacteria bacterium]